MDPARVSAQAPVVLRFDFPAGFKLNATAPSEVRLSQGGASIKKWERASIQEDRLELGSLGDLKIDLSRQLLLEATLYLCQKGDLSLCAQVRLKQPIQLGPGGTQTLVWAPSRPGSG